jgi:hypothetical protein
MGPASVVLVLVSGNVGSKMEGGHAATNALYSLTGKRASQRGRHSPAAARAPTCPPTALAVDRDPRWGDSTRSDHGCGASDANPAGDSQVHTAQRTEARGGYQAQIIMIRGRIRRRREGRVDRFAMSCEQNRQMKRRNE